MKKILIILLIVFCLVGCTSKNEGSNQEEIRDINYKIVTPSGAPSLSLIDFVDDERISIDVVDGGDVLQAEFTTANADIIIAPINLGAKLSSVTGNYKLAAVLTWGNLHLVSTLDNIDDLNKVAAFGQAAVPGKVLNYLSDELPFEFEWFENVNEASASLLAGKNNAAVLAEPILTMTKAKSENEIHELVDIQELYKEKTGFDSYPQAALFVNVNIAESEDLKYFLNQIDMANDIYNKDNDALAKRIDEIDLSVLGFGNPDLIKKAYSKMALDYKEVGSVKEEIKTFLELFDISLDEKIIN